MAPVHGRPFLEHQMDYWIGQGVNRFVLSVGYMKDVIMDHFGDIYQSIPLMYAAEDKPLGTGGGALLAARGVSEPFLLLNGDTFFEVDLEVLEGFHAEHGSEWTFSLFRANEAGRYMGIDVKPNGEIASLKSGTGQPGRLANGGVYLINPSALAKAKYMPGQKVSLEDDILSSFQAHGGKLYGLEFSGSFIDIGVPQDYFRAAEMLPH
jgi:D-glycero-alpha-D-manno-heptose 1-phosphate guanylyltransferase